MIADDDKIVLQRIARHLKSSFSNLSEVYTAQDGVEAFALYEQKKPDILFTDIAMPRCDGLELVERLQQSGYKPKVVIISAHESFNYARNAIRFGVKNYLLKPVLPSRIREVAGALLKELEDENHLYEDYQELFSVRKNNLPVLRESFIQMLMSEGENQERIRELALLADLDLAGTHYMASIVRVSGLPEGQARKEALLEFCGFLEAAAAVLAKAGVVVYAVPFGGASIALLAISKGAQEGGLFEQMHSFLDQTFANVEKHFGYAAAASFGSVGNTIGSLAESCREAARVLRSAEGKEPKALPHATHVPLVVDRELEKRLMQEVKVKAPPHLLAQADALLEKAVGKGLSLEALRDYLLCLCAAMLREYAAAQQEGGIEAEFHVLFAAAGVEECRGWFRAFLQRLAEAYDRLNASGGNPIVNKAKHVIRDRLGDSALGVDAVAAMLYVSSNYLRYLFAQHSEESFVEYLTRVRIEYAVDKLRNTELKVQEISEMAGYSNQRYFSSCIKKRYGKTPSEIRGE